MPPPWNNNRATPDPFAETILSESGCFPCLPEIPMEAHVTQSAAEPALPTDQDTHYLLSLQELGLLEELDDREVLRMVAHATTRAADERAVALLDAYYHHHAPSERSARRARQDRTFVIGRRSGETLQGLLARIAMVAPELRDVRLERLGTQAESVWLVRLGEHFRFVDELDGFATTFDGCVSLVDALNSLLEGRVAFVQLATSRSGTRFVGLRSPLTQPLPRL